MKAFISRPVFYIFALSCIAYIVFSYYLFPIGFFPDSEQYLLTARALLGQSNGEFFYFRTCGYPLIMNLFGVTILDTFYPLIVFQVITAIMIPIFIYKTLANIYPKAAMYAALITIFSFTPVFFAKVIMTDQLAMFLRYLLIYLASICIFKDPKKIFYRFFIFVGLLLYLTRPSDALTFLIMPIIMLVFGVSNWRRWVLTIIVFMVLAASLNKARDIYAINYSRNHHVNSTSVVGAMTGKMLFFNIYAIGPKLVGHPTISRNNGEYSKKFFTALYDWGQANPMGVNSYSTQGATAYPTIYTGVNSPETFVDALIAEEGLFAHSVMWLALDQQVKAYKADQIFLRAAIESYLANPKALLFLYDGMVDFFFAGDVVYNRGKRETWNHLQSIGVYVPESKGFSLPLKEELQKSASHVFPFILLLSEFLFFWITGIKVIATLLGIACMPANFVHSKKTACLTTMLIVMLLYQAATAVVFAAPHYRYILPQVPLVIMLAVLGVASFKKLLSDRIAVGSVNKRMSFTS